LVINLNHKGVLMNKQFLSLITVFLLFGLNSFLFAQGNGDKEKEVLTTSELSQKTNVRRAPRLRASGRARKA